MPEPSSELIITGQVTDVAKSQSQQTAPATINYDTVVIPPQESNDDIITLSIRDDELPDSVLKAVLMGLAEEQQAIKLLREKKERENSASGTGKDISHLSIKRGTLLKYMSETLLQRQALVGGTGEIDLKSPKFRELLKLLLTTIAETFDQAKIPSEYKNLFFSALGPNLEAWEHKAEKIIKTVH